MKCLRKGRVFRVEEICLDHVQALELPQVLIEWNHFSLLHLPPCFLLYLCSCDWSEHFVVLVDGGKWKMASVLHVTFLCHFFYAALLGSFIRSEISLSKNFCESAERFYVRNVCFPSKRKKFLSRWNVSHHIQTWDCPNHCHSLSAAPLVCSLKSTQLSLTTTTSPRKEGKVMLSLEKTENL